MNQKILQFGLLAAIALPVLDLGGTEPIGWGLAEILIFSLGICLVIYPPGNFCMRSWKLILPPVALLLWIAAQRLETYSGKIGFDTHSLETRGLDLVAAIVVFFLAAECMCDRQPRKREKHARLAYGLILTGLFEAFMGLTQYLAGWNYIWTTPRTFYTGSATGSFINHNHFAGFLEMVLPFSLALAYGHWARVPLRGRTHRRRGSVAMETLANSDMQKCLVLLLAAVVLLTAIIFSLSRMGLISIVASIAAMFAASLAGRRSVRPALLMLVLLAAGVASATWMGVAPVLDHFEQLPRNELMASGEGRQALWKNSAQLIGLHPWTGVGLGSFQYAFTAIEVVGFPRVIDHAHNDYIELAAELGLPAASTLFLLFLWLTARALQASLHSPSGRARALALGSFGATVALLVHSGADFNLYIPANALVFAACLGIGYGVWARDCSGIRAAKKARAEIPSADAIGTPAVTVSKYG